jgi:hypothetical protein
MGVSEQEGNGKMTGAVPGHYCCPPSSNWKGRNCNTNVHTEGCKGPERRQSSSGRWSEGGKREQGENGLHEADKAFLDPLQGFEDSRVFRSGHNGHHEQRKDGVLLGDLWGGP